MTGSTINVENNRVEITPEAKRPFTEEIKIHTLGNSVIPAPPETLILRG